MRSINISSAKGGQGCTSLVIALATFLQSPVRRIAIVTNDDFAATAGLPQGESVLHDEPYAPQLFTDKDLIHDDRFDVVIRDNMAGDNVLYVVRNDYVALRNSIAMQRRYENPMGFVLFNDPTRMLVERDVINAMKLPHLGTVTLSDGVARAIDAGLYVSALLSRTKPMLPLLRVCQSIALHYGFRDLETVDELV